MAGVGFYFQKTIWHIGEYFAFAFHKMSRPSSSANAWFGWESSYALGRNAVGQRGGISNDNCIGAVAIEGADKG